MFQCLYFLPNYSNIENRNPQIKIDIFKHLIMKYSKYMHNSHLFISHILKCLQKK